MEHETQLACLVDDVVRPRVEQDRAWTGSVLGPYQCVDRVPVDALAERRIVSSSSSGRRMASNARVYSSVCNSPLTTWES
jgi:hypothetical protein